jgi:bisphosphoglycerate-dependent phosphoglycerate mutase
VTYKGIEQNKALGLKVRVGSIKFDSVYSSEAVRTQNISMIIMETIKHFLSINTTSELLEQNSSD